MGLIQVRLPEGLITEIDALVDKGYYPNKSDVIRDAIRRLILDKHIGSIPDSGDSVQEVRTLRKNLSKKDIDLAEINSL